MTSLIINETMCRDIRAEFDKLHIFIISAQDEAMKFTNGITDLLASNEEQLTILKKYLDANNQLYEKAEEFATSFRVGTLMDFRESDSITVPYNLHQESYNSRKKVYFEMENSVLAWLLAWTFEKYESFLKKVYVNIGIENQTPDKNSHFKLDAEEIYKKIKKHFPQLGEYEIKNIHSGNTCKNHHWKMAYIMKMRHIIVHCQGVVTNMSSFNERITQKLGLTNNFNFKQFLAFCELQYFKESIDKNSKKISLSQRQLNTTLNQNRITCQLNELTNFISNFAFLITNTICESIE